MEESINTEINKQCPKVATKKGLHIWTPTKKVQHTCAAEADIGNMHGEGRDGQHSNRDRAVMVA